MNCESESVTRPSANTPAVCVTVTVPPRIMRVARLPARAREVGGDHRLAVPGREGVEHAEHEREAERGSAPQSVSSPPFSISETKPPSLLAELDASAGADSSRAGMACTARPPEPSAATVVSERTSGGECSRSVG